MRYFGTCPCIEAVRTPMFSVYAVVLKQGCDAELIGISLTASVTRLVGLKLNIYVRDMASGSSV